MQLTLARRRVAALGVKNIQFEESDLAVFTTDKKFDAIVGRFVLLYVPDRTMVLRRLSRHLRPGAIVALQELDMSQISEAPPSELFMQARRWILEAFAAGADNLTQRLPNPYLLRASATSSQAMQPMGHYAATEMKLKRVVTISEDFAFGYEQMGGFQSAFQQDGGCVINKLWPPLVTPDYTPYVAQISDCDGVCQGFAGSNPLRFMKAYASAGLKYPVVSGETGGDDALLKSFGEEAIGLISCTPYTVDLDTSGNNRFVEGMLKNYDTVPGQYAAIMYVSCQVVDAGLKAVGGDASDKDKLTAAMRAVDLKDTPRGPVKFDHFGNIVGSFFVRRLGTEGAKYGLKLWNKTIKTYENVSQFWTWPEQEFLAHPVYSRDYPPLTKC